MIHRHCCWQLRYLPKPHYGSLHRMSSKSSFGNQWRVYRGLGNLQCMCISERRSFWRLCHLDNDSSTSTLFTSTAFQDGSKRVKCARWITGNGSSRRLARDRVLSKYPILIPRFLSSIIVRPLGYPLCCCSSVRCRYRLYSCNIAFSCDTCSCLHNARLLPEILVWILKIVGLGFTIVSCHW